MSGQKKRALAREQGEDDVEDGVLAPKKRSVTIKVGDGENQGIRHVALA